jgi:transcriptional regulator with XRE-family HTH domain
MVTLAQRIEELRIEKGLSRPALAAALHFPKMALEKFETGRQTPSKEQQEQLANFFGVSLFYLRGESNDRTRQDNWMNGDFVDDEPVYTPAPKKVSRPASQNTSSGEQGGTLFDSFAGSKAFQDMVRSAVLEVLRSPEGQNLLTQAIRKELSQRR